MNLRRLKRFPSPFEVARNFIKYNCFLPIASKPFLPRAMCVYVTYRCNMRCRMCGIWKRDSKYSSNELSLEELDGILSDPLFSRLEFININGGEPNLREDLVEIAGLLIDRFPHLKTLTLNSNGLPPDRNVENMKRIANLCKSKHVQFSVSISLHKIGSGYDQIAGIDNAYLKVKAAFDGLKNINQDKNFYVSANCVITSLNLFNLEEMLSWGENEDIPMNFTLGEMRERFNNLEMAETINIKEADKKYLIEFFRRLAKEKRTYLQHALRYIQLANMIENKAKRTLACHYAMGGVTLGSDGLLYYCKKSKAIGSCRDRSAYDIYFNRNNLEYRERYLIRGECASCPPNTFNKIEAEKDLFKIIMFLLFSWNY